MTLGLIILFSVMGYSLWYQYLKAKAAEKRVKECLDEMTRAHDYIVKLNTEIDWLKGDVGVTYEEATIKV